MVGGAVQLCLSTAAQCRDKVTLRSLSMVVRHAAPSAAQQTDNAKQSVKYAEQAVQLDVTDGQSWGSGARWEVECEGAQVVMCCCCCFLQLPWEMRTWRCFSREGRMPGPCRRHDLPTLMQ